MGKINSRNKGNKNERKAAGLIAAWTKKQFSRTPSSGGLQWKSSNSKGDIVCTTEGHYFPFCVEIKAHKEINFAELLIPNKKGVKVLEFWEQAVRDAEKCGKIPLLMMRYNGMPADLFFIVIPREIWKEIWKELPPCNYIHYIGISQLCIYPSTYFFNSDYKKIRLIIKKYIKSHAKKTKTI